jgi:hypothetical protein
MKERDILEKSIEDHQKAIDDAKSKLAELDKPKLRHGDYGVGVNKRDKAMDFVYDGSKVGNHFYCLSKDGTEYEGIVSKSYFKSIDILGNLGDDIAERSKDQKSYTQEWSEGKVVYVEAYGTGIRWKTGTFGTWTYEPNIEVLKSEIKNMQQVINYIENQK